MENNGNGNGNGNGDDEGIGSDMDFLNALQKKRLITESVISERSKRKIEVMNQLSDRTGISLDDLKALFL